MRFVERTVEIRRLGENDMAGVPCGKSRWGRQPTSGTLVEIEVDRQWFESVASNANTKQGVPTDRWLSMQIFWIRKVSFLIYRSTKNKLVSFLSMGLSWRSPRDTATCPNSGGSGRSDLILWAFHSRGFGWPQRTRSIFILFFPFCNFS